MTQTNTLTGTPPQQRSWRTVDVVVTAVIAVAFGVVFWAWDALWNALANTAFAASPASALLYGVWILPAVVGGLIVRKPGAAAGCLFIAAIVAAAIGNSWGLLSTVEGAVEGLAAELGFAVFLYRAFRLPVGILAGALGGLAAGIFDAFVYYPGTSWAAFRLPYIGCALVSSAVVAGLGGWLLVRALAGTGVLDRFGAGRERVQV